MKYLQRYDDRLAVIINCGQLRQEHVFIGRKSSRCPDWDLVSGLNLDAALHFTSVVWVNHSLPGQLDHKLRSC